jgi:uncharacterized protein (TIGR03086 family)
MIHAGRMDRELLSGARRALRAAVVGVPATDWNRPTPCDRWNVTQVLQHAAGDQLAWAAAVGGGPGPAENPFTPSGRLSDTPQAVVDGALERSAGAWSAVGDNDPDVPTPLPQGPMPAWLAAGACALDAAVHAWDIAVATGQDSPLSQALAEPLMTVAAEIVEPLRGFAYAPALDGPAAGDAAAKLLLYLGRDPSWTG